MSGSIKLSGGRALLSKAGVRTCCCRCCESVTLDDLLGKTGKSFGWERIFSYDPNAPAPGEGWRRKPACLRFVCICTRQGKTCYTEFGGPTYTGKDLWGFVSQLFIAAGEAIDSIDLGQVFPEAPLVAKGEFYGEAQFGPWAWPVAITGSVNVDDDLYINGAMQAGDAADSAGPVQVNVLLPAGNYLLLNVKNSSVYGGPCAASGTLQLTRPQFDEGCTIYRIEFYGWKGTEVGDWQSADDKYVVRRAKV